MRRVAAITGTWIGLLVAAAAAYIWPAEGVALERALQRYNYRESLKDQLRDVERDRPVVVWMGDSTMIGIKLATYPPLVGRMLPDVPWGKVAFFGSDFFTFYPIVGELLEHHRPALLVLVAHLRFFRQPSADTARVVATRNDLLSFVPTSELTTAMRLPLDTRGMTIPRLLLARLLRYELVEHAMYLADGARALVAEAELSWLGPTRPAHAMTGKRAIDLALGGSDVPITVDQPTVRMMAETVRLARRHDVRVLVIGYPVPPATTGYDHTVYANRFAILRDIVAGAGGVFVDLHEALPNEMFQDAIGHLTREGHQRIADHLRRVVVRELGPASAPPPPAAP